MEHPSDGISMEIISKFMGRRTSYKIQFIAPAIVRYYFPKCAFLSLPQYPVPVLTSLNTMALIYSSVVRAMQYRKV